MLYCFILISTPNQNTNKQIGKLNKLKEDYPNAFEKYCKDNHIELSSIDNLPRKLRKQILSVNLSVWQYNIKL